MPLWKKDSRESRWGQISRVSLKFFLGISGPIVGTPLLRGAFPSELALLPWLQELQLYGSWDWENEQLTGPITHEMGQLTFLEQLTIQGYNLTGSIPTELGQLPLLERLELPANQLSGPIPPELGQLQRLKYVRLQDIP